MQAPRATLSDTVKSQLDGVDANIRDDDIRLSEPIIASARCVNDPAHSNELDNQTRWQPAANFTDAITHCTLCDDASIRVDIIESISPAQVAQAGGALNCKYVRLPGGCVIELT